MNCNQLFFRLLGCMVFLFSISSQAQNTTATATQSAVSTTDLSAKIPFNPEVKKGTLENGLTYYIKNNGKPAMRAQSWKRGTNAGWRILWSI